MTLLETTGNVVLGVAAASLAASVVILLLAHKRSRSTLFTDAAWKAAFLVGITIYLGYVADRAASFGGDPAFYRLMEGIAHVLIAAFFAFLGIYLWRYAGRGMDFVIVSPEFLLAMRDRMKTIYGASPARFVSYAVGKDAARGAVARSIQNHVVKPAQAWRRMPYYLRLFGYGRVRVVSGAPGSEMRIAVAGTFETLAPAGTDGCDLTRGYLAGLGEALEEGASCEAEEVRCATHEGGGECEFVLRWFPAGPDFPDRPQTQPSSVAEVR